MQYALPSSGTLSSKRPRQFLSESWCWRHPGPSANCVMRDSVLWHRRAIGTAKRARGRRMWLQHARQGAQGAPGGRIDPTMQADRSSYEAGPSRPSVEPSEGIAAIRKEIPRRVLKSPPRCRRCHWSRSCRESRDAGGPAIFWSNRVNRRCLCVGCSVQDPPISTTSRRVLGLGRPVYHLAGRRPIMRRG